MRGFVALLRKEWRDVRALTWTCMPLVVVAALVTRWVHGEVQRDVWAAPISSWFVDRNVWMGPPRWYEPFVPCVVGFYAALVTADTVGGEVASRRSDALALLPAGPFRVWLAKLVTACGASLVFAAWTLLVQILVLWGVDGSPHAAAFVDRGATCAWTLSALALLVGSTMLVSTLRLRGIAAAVGGALLAAGLWSGANAAAALAGFSSSDWNPYLRTFSYSHRREWVAALLTVPAVLAAAALAYRFGRVHLGRVLRPLGIAVGVLVPLLVAPPAVLAQRALSVVPGEPGVRLSQAWPSPDGRYVALDFTNWESGRQPSKTFVLDVGREALVEPQCGNACVSVSPWTLEGAWSADGRLVLTSYERAADGTATGTTRFHVDPSTGAVVRRDVQDAATARTVYDAWRDVQRWFLKANAKRDDGGPPFVAFIADARTSGNVLDQRTWIPAVMADPRRGLIVYAPEPCVLAIREMPDGPERRVLTSAVPWERGQVSGLSPDGRELLVAPGGTWCVLDLAAGKTAALPACGAPPQWWTSYGGAQRRRIVLRDGPKAPTATVLDLDTGARMEIPADGSVSPRGLADGGFVLQRSGGVLDLYDADLRLVRRLWPLDGKAGGR